MKKRMSYELIDHPDSMCSAMESLTGVSLLALDLEMENHYHHYGLHIALIQVSTPEGRTFVFDPLSGIALQPLGALLVDPRVELIIHDADFDKRACYQVYRWRLSHFFDTKVAAQLCGFRKFGLAGLLNDLLKVETDKRFQRIDWLKRPLRKDALDYAAGETTFLYALRDILEKRLIELGRLSWAQEEFLYQERLADAEPRMPAHYRIKSSSFLSPRRLAVLASLATFRDQLARILGRPVHFVIRDKTLIQLAISPPVSVQELQKVQGLHPAVYRGNYALRFMEAVNRGLTAPEDSHPLWSNRPPSTPGYGERLKAMQKWRAHVAAKVDLEPYLLLSTDVLAWCARNPEQPVPHAIASRIRNWQKALIWDDFRGHFSIPEKPPRR